MVNAIEGAITIDVLDRSYAKKLFNGLSSGYQSSTVTDNADGSKTLTITFVNGDKADITFNPVKGDTGTSIVDVKIKQVTVGTDEEIHLFCILDDGSEIDAGKLPIEGSKINETEIDITTPSTTWSLQHNLNTPWYELSVLIIDSDNNRTYGNVDVDNCTDNVFMLKFDEPISGKAIVKK